MGEYPLSLHKDSFGFIYAPGERGQGGALPVGGGDHKNVKNKRKLTKLGKKFPWVKNIQDQPWTTIMNAQGTSERGDKEGFFMLEGRLLNC